MDGHRIFETQDGSRSLFSERYGVSYHSKYGALQETRHIFIEAGLRHCAVDRTHLEVLEVGYGTGLNCLASLLHAARVGLSLNYVGLDPYPVPDATLARLDYPTAIGLGPAGRTLAEGLTAISWPGQAWLTPKLRVEKRLDPLQDLTERDRYDLVYFDAFAPEAQPELWTPAVFALLHAAVRPGAALVTYCAKGQVKRDLRAAGFTVERLQGPPGKREMTRAVRKA